MNDLILTPRPVCELLTDVDLVTVTGRAHPLKFQEIRRQFAPGMTIEELVEATIPAHWPREWVKVNVDGLDVPARFWGHARPRAGRNVRIVGLPAGGGQGRGKGVFQVLFAAILIVAGILLIATGVGAGFGSGLISMGLGMGVQGWANILIPPPRLPQLAGTGKQISPNFFIQGSRNTERPFEPIPRVYGQHRITPDLGAKTWVEQVGDNQFLRMVFIFGTGPLVIDDMRIAATALADFQDIEYEVRNGFPYDKPLALFPNSVLTTAVGATLTTTYQSRQSENESDELMVDIYFPRGLVHYSSTGSLKKQTVTVSVQYRLVGASVWIDASTWVLTESQPNPFARTLRWTVTRGLYEFQVKRTTAESTKTSTMDQVVWSSFKNVVSEDPLSDHAALFKQHYADGLPIKNYRGGLAKISMRIRATDQLNGVVDQFNALVTAIVPDYDQWSIDFDGSSDAITIGTAPQRTGALARSYECWAYARAQAGILFQAGKAGVGDFSLKLDDPSTETWLIVLNTGSDSVSVVIPGSVGAWHHYALTYDPTTTTTHLYFDGVEVASKVATINTASKSIYLGALDGTATFFSGRITQFRVYPVYRMAAEVLADYNAPVEYDPRLLDYWRMSEGSGTKIYDYAFGNLHVSIAGPSWVQDGPFGECWEPRPTRNPASAYRDIIQGQSNFRPVADDHVDLLGLQRWHELNRDRGVELDCQFNMVALAPAPVALTWDTTGGSPAYALHASRVSGEYYVTLAAGGNPGAPPSPTRVEVTYSLSPLSSFDANRGTVGSLADNHYGIGDNDSLGFSTLYIRCDLATPLIFHVNYVSSGAYLYVNLSSLGAYTLQSGDYLEYDVYWPSREDEDDDKFIAVDLKTSTQNMKNEGAVDQNGLSSHPAMNLSTYALNLWYERKIAIPASMIGNAVAAWVIGCEADGGGTFRGYIRNIRITDGKGTVRHAAWMVNDTQPTTIVDYTSDAAQTFSVTAKTIREISKGRHFNFIFDVDGTNLSARQVCSMAGYATPNLGDGGKHSIIIDAPQPIPRGTLDVELTVKNLVSQRNSANFTGSIAFPEFPHGLRLRFIDEDQDFKNGQITAYDDGFTEDNSTVFQSVDVKGITNAQEVHRFGRRIIATMHERPESFTAEQDFENLCGLRGDRVKLTHDVASVGLGSMRIKALHLTAGLVDQITLDDFGVMDPAKNYVLRVRNASGSSLHPVTGHDGSTTIQTVMDVVTTFNPSTIPVAVGDLVLFGELGKESLDCIISTIEPLSDAAARITLVPYGFPAIDDAEDGAIAPYDAKIGYTPGLQRSLATPIIRGIVTDESALVRLPSGDIQPRIIVNVEIPTTRDEIATQIQGQIRETRGSGSYRSLPAVLTAEHRFIFDGVETGLKYDIHIRTLTDNGLASEWVEQLGVLVIGTSTPPADVADFKVTEFPTGKRVFSWDLGIVPIDIIGVQIRGAQGTGLTWDQMYPIHAGILPVPPFETARLVAGHWTLGCKAIDIAGNESVNAFIIEKTFSVMPQGFLTIQDAREMRWPGSLTNGFINDHKDYAGVGDIEGIGGDTWATLTTWAAWTDWDDGTVTPGYIHPTIDLGVERTVIPQATYGGVGTIAVAVRQSPDGGAWGPWVAIGSEMTNRYFQFGITATQALPDSPIPLIQDLVVYL